MCNACGEILPLSSFNKNSETHDGYRYTCKTCRKNRVPANPKFSKQTRKPSKKYTRVKKTPHSSVSKAVYYRLRKYNLSLDEYHEMINRQDGLCAICSVDLGEKFCVDHCHDSGAVRGLLCYSCNTGIGLLGDSPERLRLALSYLDH